MLTTVTWRLALVVLLPWLAVPAPGSELSRRDWLSAASAPANGAIVAGA